MTYQSSMELFEKYNGTRHAAEAAAVVLMHAADYLYKNDDPCPGHDGEMQAVETLDDLRADMGFNCATGRKPGESLPSISTLTDDDGGRTRIGNTPTCEDCDQPLDDCTCGDDESPAENAECTCGQRCATVDEWHDIAAAITAEGFPATLEGGGAACPFLQIDIHHGRYMLLGDVNDTWSADFYPSLDAVSNANMDESKGIDLEIRTTVHDPAQIAKAFRAAVTDACITGNPAILGICGDAECVCAPDPRIAFKAALQAYCTAAQALSEAWPNDDVKAYPAHLPSFDEHVRAMFDFRDANL